MNLLCVSFETVGNVNGKATLNDVINTTQLTSCDENGVNGDYINTWNMSIGNWGAAYQYINASAGWGEGYENTWMSNDEPVNPIVDPGAAFWLYAVNDIPALQFAGQVASGTINYTLTGGSMNLIANPFPTSLNLNDSSVVTIANKTSCDENGLNGDYINTWNSAIGNWGTAYQYINASAGWGEGYEDTWMSNDEPCDTVIHAGTGFWYYAVGDNTTFTFAAQE